MRKQKRNYYLSMARSLIFSLTFFAGCSPRILNEDGNIATSSSDDGSVASDDGSVASDDGSVASDDGSVGCNDYDRSCDSIPSGMSCVPSSKFYMGSSTDTSPERPVREICMPTFYIDETEVTVSMYQDCIDNGGCENPSSDHGCNFLVSGREEHPINCVSWTQAQKYCEWKDRRLPTEAEWEKAGKGTGKRRFPWGNELPTCEYATMSEGGDGCGKGSTMVVGSKSPKGDSPYGLMDMAGNVTEWVSDWFWGEYDPGQIDNPQGPLDGTFRVTRGGAWFFYAAEDLRVSARGVDTPSARFSHIGFRCAKSKL